MTTGTPPPPPAVSQERARYTPPDPTAVAAKVRELVLLEQANPGHFAEALADNIMEPVAVETAAFRHEELVFKSASAAKLLGQKADEVANRRDRTPQQRRAHHNFMVRVAQERRLLDSIVTGLRAQRGLLPNAPNPRQRAMRRLVDENLAGDVPRGRFRVLFEEEKEVDAARKREARRNRKRK